MNQSLDQQAAAFAWSRVNEHLTNGRPDDDYVNTAKAAPALIMSNGLMQAFAYYHSKNKVLLTDLLAWLGQRMGSDSAGRTRAPGPPLGTRPDFSSAMRYLQGSSSERYMQATEETQAILKWIRQFADALKRGG